MFKTLEEKTTIKIGSKWCEVKASLVIVAGGKRVVYTDKEGNELHSQPYSRSKYYKEDKID